MARHFHFVRPDGSTLKSDHYETQHPDASHPRYRGNVAAPKRVDLRPFLTPVEDQQQTSSCVANAAAGSYEYLVKRHQRRDYDVSRLFIYYNGRTAEGDPGEDAGMFIKDAVKGLKEYGACSEITWPFDADLVTTEPSLQAYDEAAQFLLEDAQVVPTALSSWRSALAEGYPVMFGIKLYQSFDKQRRRGVVPLPSPTEAARASHGGHAMLCVGYSDTDEMFIVRNSWGTTWGDAGYCYIPYAYLMDARFNDGDSWILRQLEHFPGGARDAWSNSDESLLEEIDGEIANMSEAAFGAFIDACGAVHFETRVAALFLTVAGADGKVSRAELEAIGAYLEKALAAVGVASTAEAVLTDACKRTNGDVIKSTIAVFAAHLSKPALGAMIGQLQAVASADGIGNDEQQLVNALVQAWQVGAV